MSNFWLFFSCGKKQHFSLITKKDLTFDKNETKKPQNQIFSFQTTPIKTYSIPTKQKKSSKIWQNKKNIYNIAY